MRYPALAIGSILVLLVSAGCTGSGPAADFVNGRMFTGKGAPQTTSASAASSTQENTATTTISGSTTTTLPITTSTPSIPRNLTCDRKWGQLARDQCYLDFGVGIRDVRICRNLTYKSLRENCFYSIGIDSRNLSACNMVEDDIKRKNCFDTVQQTEDD